MLASIWPSKWTLVLGALLLFCCCIILPKPCAFQRIVREPQGLKQSLTTLPMRALNATELETFEDDGVLVVRGAIADEAILRNLSRAIWRGGIPPHNASLPNNWVTNGALRSLIRDSPLAILAAASLQTASVRIGSTALWYKPPLKHMAGVASQPWHVDSVLTESGARIVTVWLALTDSPDAIEVIKGSHKVVHGCSYKLTPSQMVDLDCINHSYAANLTAARGKPGSSAKQLYSAKPGDAILLDSRLWHRGYSQARSRLSVSLRFYPADTVFEREMINDFGVMYYLKYAPDECNKVDGPLFPVAFPPSRSTMDAVDWPLTITWYDFFKCRLQRVIYEVQILSGWSPFKKCRDTSAGTLEL